MVVQIVFDTGEGVSIYLLDADHDTLATLRAAHGHCVNAVGTSKEIEGIISNFDTIPGIVKVYDATDAETVNEPVVYTTQPRIEETFVFGFIP